MRKLSCVLAMLIALGAGCIRKPADKAADTKSQVVWPDEPNECPAGYTYTPFMLEEGQPGQLKTVFPQIADEKWQPAGPKFNIRLDICMGDDGSLKLRQIVRKFQGATPETDQIIIGNDDSAVVEGLEQAMFEQDMSKLRIMPGGNMPFGFVIFGGREPSGATYAAAGVAALDGDKWKSLGVGWVVGTLVSGDPFGTTKCPYTTEFKEELFKVGTAEIAAEKCVELTNMGATRYWFLKLTVKDSNEALAPEFRGKTVVLEGEKLNTMLQYTITHHNERDTWRLDLGYAYYRRDIEIPNYKLEVRYGNRNQKEWTEPMSGAGTPRR